MALDVAAWRRADRLSRRTKLALAIGAFILGSISACLSFRETDRIARMSDFEVETRYEGVHDENLGFIASIAANAKHRFRESPEYEEEQENERSVERLLGEVSQQALDLLSHGISPERPAHDPGTADTPELDVDLEDLAGLLFHPKLSTVSIEHFGLTRRRVSSQTPPNRPNSAIGTWFLETDFENGRSVRSYVFVPASLVIQDSAALSEADSPVDLSPLVKRELVLAKILERVVLDPAAGFEDRLQQLEASSLYFIPPSGFAYLITLGQQEASEYKDYLDPVASFSDRTYFQNASSSTTSFYATELYFDGIGESLVRSYCRYIRVPELNLEGMLVVDRRLPTADDLLTWLADKGPLTDFQIYRHRVTPDASRQNASEYQELLKRVRKRYDASFSTTAAWIDSNVKQATGEVQRHVVDDRTLFTVPVGAEEVAILSLDPRWWKRSRFYHLILFAASLVSLGAMIALARVALRDSLRSEREHEEAEQRHTQILQRLQGGFLIVSRDRVIVEANDKFRDIVQDQECVGQPIGKYFIEKTAAEIIEHQTDAGKSGFEITGSTLDTQGSIAPAIITGTPLTIKEEPGASMLIVIPSKELEITIGSRFLQSFSHALKTPAHSIVMLSQSFRRKKNFPKFETNLSLLRNEVREFSSLIDNILQFSELEIKDVKVTKKPEDLAPTLRTMASMATTRIKTEKKSIEIVRSFPSRIPANVDLEVLKIALNNLVDNAVKYTDSGVIRFQAIQQKSAWRIEIHDTGIGIRDEDRDRVFQIFYRSEDPTVQSRDGLGIGLYVSKRYIELHGGDLEVQQSSENGSQGPGSVFIVTLPVNDAEAAA